MKTIQPVNLWCEGQNVQANVLDAKVINDDLSASAQFYYSLCSSENLTTLLATGNLAMSGEDYAAYETNQNAWNWIAQKLNIIIINDYTPKNQ